MSSRRARLDRLKRCPAIRQGHRRVLVRGRTISNKRLATLRPNRKNRLKTGSDRMIILAPDRITSHKGFISHGVSRRSLMKGAMENRV